MPVACQRVRSHTHRFRTSRAWLLRDTIRRPDHAEYGELDTPATLLYCSAQFAPDRLRPAPPAPWPHGGAT
ncbi:hypothetical protein D1006_33710 [Burkholderia stabilis]|uniref:Uncharacterized protein n=1 Tax=Burkholderia stabilis TaxID=95485 RepID=A0A4Q2A790_9BURK|nr:hypothetical protein D1006_33710 [Burkholderia stabilis]